VKEEGDPDDSRVTRGSLSDRAVSGRAGRKPRAPEPSSVQIYNDQPMDQDFAASKKKKKKKRKANAETSDASVKSASTASHSADDADRADSSNSLEDLNGIIGQLSVGEIVKLADERYLSLLGVDGKDDGTTLTIHYVTSSLSDAETGRLNSLCKKLKGKNSKFDIGYLRELISVSLTIFLSPLFFFNLPWKSNSRPRGTSKRARPCSASPPPRPRQSAGGGLTALQTAHRGRGRSRS